jgi:cobalt-zinc-cadmium efflux system outer membrane protein
LATALVAGCVSTNPDRAFLDVQDTVASRTGMNLNWIRDEPANEQVVQCVKAILEKELTVDSVVQVALLNNRALQATFEEIGISQADLVQAGMLKNPTLGASARFPDTAPSSTNLEFSLVSDLVDLMLRPLRLRLATQQLEQTKLRVSDQVLDLIAEVKAAFYTVQARDQLMGRLAVIVEADEAAAKLAKAQYDAGNINELDLTNQQTRYNETRIEQERARLQERRDHEALNRLMGTSGAGWTIAAQLPDIPSEEFPLDQMEALALAQRLDLAAMNQQVAMLGSALSAKKKTRLLPAEINVGFGAEREPDKVWLKGPRVELNVPVFDRGQGKVASLEAQLRQAQRLTEALTNLIRSEVNEANAALAANRAVTEVYQKGLYPQRARILALTLEQYNYMLKGAYDLLLARQQQANTELSYIEAWRDYWIARGQLERAVGGQLPTAAVGPSVDTSPPGGDARSPALQGSDASPSTARPDTGGEHRHH